MSDGGASAVSAPETLGVRALREWITAEREEYSRVLLVEPGASADGIGDAVGPDDVVLLPEGSGPYDGPARTARYRGALCEIGDELFFGERGVELQDYVAAAFVQIVGPTAVCFADASSWDAFLDDAELARHTGVFPTPMIDPRVLLAGRSALIDPTGLDTPSAVRVGPDGDVGVGIRGGIIGSVSELRTLLATPVPRGSVLGGTVPADEPSPHLHGRDWIGRYLNATDLMKMLRLPNGAARISGFGWHAVDDDLADAAPRPADPFLLDTADGFVLADTTTLRRQSLSPVTATVVAVTQTSSTPEVATERLARQLGRTASDVGTLCVDAVAALGIRFGTRPDIASGGGGSAP